MAKKRRVDTFHHKTGVVELFLNNDNNFYAYVAGRTITKPSMSELKAEVHRVLEASTELTWRLVIEIKEFEPFGTTDENHIGFSLERFAVGLAPNEVWMMLRWYDFMYPDAEHSGFMQYHYSHDPVSREVWDTGLERFKRSRRDDHRADFSLLPLHKELSHYLPYDEELWTGLSVLQKGIADMKKKLDGIIRSDAGLNKLRKLRDPGKLFLGAGGG